MGMVFVPSVLRIASARKVQCTYVTVFIQIRWFFLVSYRYYLQISIKALK